MQNLETRNPLVKESLGNQLVNLHGLTHAGVIQHDLAVAIRVVTLHEIMAVYMVNDTTVVTDEIVRETRDLNE